MDFSRLVLLLHRWTGLASCAFLVVVALSGSVLVYARPLNRALVPSLHRIEPRGTRGPLAATLQSVAARHPQDPPIVLRRGPPDEPDEVILRSWVALTVNPYSGAVIGERRPNRSVVGVIGAIHSSLLAGKAGHILVGIAGLAVLFEAVTGLIRWWRYRTFWIARDATFRRAVFELHNATGVFALALVVPLSITGAMLSFNTFLQRGYRSLDRQAPPAPALSLDSARVESPDDAVRVALGARAGELVEIGLPMRERDVWKVQLRAPGDRSQNGRIQVSVDRQGRVTSIVDGGEGQAGTRLKYWRDGIHGGWIFGAIGMLLAAVGGVALALQALTGFLVWWKPR